MKGRTIAVISVVSLAAVGGIGYGVYHAVTGNKEAVQVVPVSNVNYSYWGDTSYSYGTVTSNVSQTVRLENDYQVDEVFVEEGQEVKIGDPLFSYDMTLVELDLEMEKLTGQTLDLNKQSLENELKKLQNTTATARIDAGSALDSVMTASGEETEQTDPSQTNAPETEAPQTNAPQTDPPQTDAPQSQAEVPQTEAPQTDPPQTEAPQTNVPETEAPQTNAPETEAPQTNAPETEAPQTNAPETEAPQTEASPAEAPQTDAPSTEPELTAEQQQFVAQGERFINKILEWKSEMSDEQKEAVLAGAWAIYYENDILVTPTGNPVAEGWNRSSYSNAYQLKSGVTEALALKNMQSYFETAYENLLKLDYRMSCNRVSGETTKQEFEALLSLMDELKRVLEENINTSTATGDEQTYFTDMAEKRAIIAERMEALDKPAESESESETAEPETETESGSGQESETAAESESGQESETGTESESETESEGDTEDNSRKNDVLFEVAEGATVTVDGKDVTNTKGTAKDGKIVFTVQAKEGYKVTEVLVDGQTPARTTGNENEYIVEGITETTTIVVRTETVPTESETETESESETEAPISNEQYDTWIKTFIDAINAMKLVKNDYSSELEETTETGSESESETGKTDTATSGLVLADVEAALKIYQENLANGTVKQLVSEKTGKVKELTVYSLKEEAIAAINALYGDKAEEKINELQNAYRIALVYHVIALIDAIDDSSPETDVAGIQRAKDAYDILLLMDLDGSLGLRDMVTNYKVLEEYLIYLEEDEMIPPPEEESESEILDEMGDFGDFGDFGDLGDFGESYTAEELRQAIKDKESEIEEVNLQIRESELKIKQYERKVEQKVVKSTINGVVKTIGTPEGGEIDDCFVKITSASGLYLKGGLSELLLEEIQIGDVVTGSSYWTGDSFTAEITEISQYPDTSGQYANYGSGNSNASYYPFLAYIAEPGNLTEGDVEYQLPDTVSTGTGIYLPNYLIRRDSMDQYYVYKQGEDGLLHKQVVRTGKGIYGSATEILEGLTLEDKVAFPYGVNEGDETEVVDQLNDGSMGIYY